MSRQSAVGAQKREVIEVAALGALAFLLLWIRLDANNRVAFSLGLLAGIVASLLVTWWYEFATRPELEVIEDEDDPHRGEHPIPHAFYHVKVRQRRARWPFTSRRPAWGTRSDLRIYNVDRTKQVFARPISGRWAGTSEPLARVERGLLFDISKLPLTERHEIHYGHPGEQLDIAIEIEGREWYMFNSLNYLHPEWRHEPHRLPAGHYSILVTLYYETGEVRYWKYLHVPEIRSVKSPSAQGEDIYLPPEPQRPALSSRDTDIIG